MALREGFRTGRAIGENEWCDYFEEKCQRLIQLYRKKRNTHYFHSHLLVHRSDILYITVKSMGYLVLGIIRERSSEPCRFLST